LTLRDVLNRIIWDPHERASEYEVTFVHRGAPGDIRKVSVSEIEEVHRSWFLLRSQEEESATIPLHRVLEIRQVSSGRIVWQKTLRRRGGTGG